MSVRRVAREHFPRHSDRNYVVSVDLRPVLTFQATANRLGLSKQGAKFRAERALENFILGFAGVRLTDDPCTLFEDDEPGIEGTIERDTDEHVEWNEAAMEELTRLVVKIVEVA